MPLARARLSAARGAIARACLNALPDAQLGDITLGPEQRRIVARAEHALRSHGGCLIAEDVGRGKTFIALALAQRWRKPMIVAPAALRSTWMAAQARAGVACGFVSHDFLSRRRKPPTTFDLLIVDESHHFRNPATARYAELAAMSAAVPIILLSATPLQNRTRDLAAQVALFHGESAFQLGAEQLARFVIRGEDGDGTHMPNVAPPEWLHVDANDGAVLAALLDLPPPPRPRDGGDPGALREISLVRAWASSRAALTSMLRSRRRMTTAIAQGLDAGRTPSRRETREWRAAEDVVQLGLASMLMGQSADAESILGIRAQLDDEDEAYVHLRIALAITDDPDHSRVAALRTLRASHPDRRIVAFSEYASTVSMYFSALRTEPAVGLLTARQARIASGFIPRDEMLSRFAPRAQGSNEHASHDAVTLLLATDLIAEGVNLQDASVVVHLDLPWNPARLAQRVGRVRRPGGAAEVRSFLMAPPAEAEVLLAADARLRRKLEQARRVVGPGFAVLPLPSTNTTDARVPTPALDSAAMQGRLVDRLQHWVDEAPQSTTPGALEVGAVMHTARGWLVALTDGRLIGSLDGATADSVALVLRLVELAHGSARRALASEVGGALKEIEAWLATERVLNDCGVENNGGPLHRQSNACLGEVIKSARRHEQAVLMQRASRIRHHLASPMPLGAERAAAQCLEAAAREPRRAAEVLSHRLDHLDLSAHARAANGTALDAPRVVALIVVGPSTPAPDGPDAQLGMTAHRSHPEPS